MQHSADALVIHIKAAAAKSFKQSEDAIAVTKAIEERRDSKSAQVSRQRTYCHQVAGYALQFTHQQANELSPSRRLNSHQLLYSSYIGDLVEHRGEVVHVIHIADAT